MSAKKMEVLTEGPKRTVSADAVFCPQKVRFYQLAVKISTLQALRNKD